VYNYVAIQRTVLSNISILIFNPFHPLLSIIFMAKCIVLYWRYVRVFHVILSEILLVQNIMLILIYYRFHNELLRFMQVDAY